MTLYAITILGETYTAGDLIIFGLGILGQLLFSARLILQWILSEKAKKVLSPSIFWELSLAASYLFCIYGFLRHDFAIVLGQIIAYYIYIWNLNKKGIWKHWNILLRALLIATPFIVALILSDDGPELYRHFFQNEEIPLWLLLFGSAGQIIFTFRFIYQWLYSRKREESLLPMGFWLISLVGSIIIVTYAIYRRDPVLILGQSPGVIVYCRNIYLSMKYR